MMLLVDAGNSRVKWATLDGGRLTPGAACANSDLEALRKTWTDLRPERALVACVADEATRARLEALLRASGAAVQWLRAAAQAHGVINPYQPPESLGPDRYAALVAARRFAQDCVVVSVGTAMTADMLARDGRFLGGCIVPGPDLMRGALLRGTARVAAVTGEVTRFPLDTGGAVATGIALALAGVVHGMRARLAEAGGDPVVLLTGGARGGLRPLLEGPVQEVEDLVLQGLACIAHRPSCPSGDAPA
ncbi:MAG: type III pantothenate kinase [bacterium]|nr:MAG: type III pantothenate kinase [bacterium]KAF0147838.1 MAG: type III pantothenate kinase [bacterium]KAF0167440.1 MAG: type III pantothenate kinase [bacterium]TXT17831.1 MAG: type III pantothenate kinase [bacterium]